VLVIVPRERLLTRSNAHALGRMRKRAEPDPDVASDRPEVFRRYWTV
jgi:hypothetical protein